MEKPIIRHSTPTPAIVALLRAALTADQAEHALAAFSFPAFPVLPERQVTQVAHRAELAYSLFIVLVERLLTEVPVARDYVASCMTAGERITLDHGALRTVRWHSTGVLPSGQLAFQRLLEPLGYAVAGHYPLPRLQMHGRAYQHLDYPADVPQYFVSELYPEAFSPAFQASVTEVIGASRDPLTASAEQALAQLSRDHHLPLAMACALLPNLADCFARQHPEPSWPTYQALLAESREMAWIATEGNVFNHGTTRVADVYQSAEQQRLLARPIKETVEVSANGRVRQTAYRAAEVLRQFGTATPAAPTQAQQAAVVPGSFWEFITRDFYVTEQGESALDLTFDSGNATGIFKMTGT